MWGQKGGARNKVTQQADWEEKKPELFFGATSPKQIKRSGRKGGIRGRLPHKKGTACGL